MSERAVDWMRFLATPGRAEDAREASGWSADFDARGRWPGGAVPSNLAFELWPSREAPRAWVPVDRCGARTYFERTYATPAAGGRARRLLRGAEHVLRTIAGRRAIVALRPPPGGEADAPLPVLRWIAGSWQAWGLGPRPDRLSCLLLTEGYRDVNKCVLLVFEEPRPEPRIVLKMPRVPASVPGILTEEAALRHVLRKGGLDGVPRPIWCGELGGMTALVQSPEAGRPSIEVVDRADPSDLAFRVTDVLARLARLTEGPPAIEPPGQRALEEVGASLPPAVRHLMADVRQAGARAVRDFPSVTEHRDASPWNMLVRPDGGIALLDWESCEISGCPGLDLLYFLAYLAFVVEGVDFRSSSEALRACYRRALDPTTPFGAVRAACVARYAQALGLPGDRIERAGGLAWIIHLRSELANLAADQGTGRETPRLDGSVFLALLEEEHARRF